ncbi:MAG: GNAT family N-acetyltransferase [Pseudomonadota bacterium]
MTRTASVSAIEVRDLSFAEEACWKRLYIEYVSAINPWEGEVQAAKAWECFKEAQFSTAFFVVAVLDGRVIGFANAVLHDDIGYGTACYVQDLYVECSARRQGAGSSLMRKFFAAIKGMGWSQVHWAASSTNPGAIELYRQIACDQESTQRFSVYATDPYLLNILATDNLDPHLQS